jgi:hypothetical protein
MYSEISFVICPCCAAVKLSAAVMKFIDTTMAYRTFIILPRIGELVSLRHNGTIVRGRVSSIDHVEEQAGFMAYITIELQNAYEINFTCDCGTKEQERVQEWVDRAVE